MEAPARGLAPPSLPQHAVPMHEIGRAAPSGLDRVAAAVSRMRATFKQREVEEPLDYWVNRPLASLIVGALAPLPVTPNQVTLLSGIVGLVAGIVIGVAPLEPSWQVPLAGG